MTDIRLMTVNFGWIDLQITNFIQNKDGTSKPAGFFMDVSTHQITRCPDCHTLFMLTQEQWRKAEFLTIINNDGIRSCKDCDHLRGWRNFIGYDLPEIRERLEGYLDQKDFIIEYFYQWYDIDDDYYLGDDFPSVLEVREFKGLREVPKQVEFLYFEYVQVDFRNELIRRYIPIVNSRVHPKMESLL